MPIVTMKKGKLIAMGNTIYGEADSMEKRSNLNFGKNQGDLTISGRTLYDVKSIVETLSKSENCFFISAAHEVFGQHTSKDLYENRSDFDPNELEFQFSWELTKRKLAENQWKVVCDPNKELIDHLKKVSGKMASNISIPFKIGKTIGDNYSTMKETLKGVLGYVMDTKDKDTKDGDEIYLLTIIPVIGLNGGRLEKQEGIPKKCENNSEDFGVYFKYNTLFTKILDSNVLVEK